MARRRNKTKPRRSDFPFFSLPPEIRSEVYHQLLVAPAAGNAIRLPAESPPPTPIRLSPRHAILRDLRALSTVSKQIHAEAHAHFLANNHLHWHGTLTSRAWDSFQHHALPLVRELSLSVSDYQVAWMDQSLLRALLRDMRSSSIRAGKDKTASWSLRRLELVVRNDYVDLDRDDQIWYHWKTVAESKTTVPAAASGLPHVRGLVKVSVVAPWEVEEDWKAKFRRDLGKGVVVEFGKNYDRTVPKPRVGPWEDRRV